MLDLKSFRENLGATQIEMATAMGMPLRSYQDVEAGRNPVRPIHVCAARWANIKLSSGGNAPLDHDVENMILLALRNKQQN